MQPPFETLDPKNDVVFKALLTQNERLLRDVIECVLDVPPLRQITVLNPELEHDLATDKGAVLDVRCELADGMLIDLEMQIRSVPTLAKRILFYWAKLFSGQLQRGQLHEQLRKTVCIVWLGHNEFGDDRFHSVFRVREETSNTLYSDDLELHFLQLPNFDAQKVERSSKWARFFRFESPEDIEQLTAGDAIMTEAKTSLEKLSQDPRIQSLARERELAALTYRFEIAAVREMGLREGRAEGEAIGAAKGEAKGRAEERESSLRQAIVDLCEFAGITISDSQKSSLEEMSLDELESLRARIKSERKWS
jgi:predicted transposase/invertase (TIGR01784 family)